MQNPTRAGLDYPREAILDALRRPEALGYDPHPLGLVDARENLARDWAKRGFAVSADELVLTASTSEAYSLLFKVLCDPGDEVLIPEPSYPLFETLAGLDGVAARAYRLGYDGAWSIDHDSARAALGARTRAIVVVSPNNPTGSFLKKDELEALSALGVPLIVDEVFWPYAFETDARRVETVLECPTGLVFALDGLSKRAALPQLKLGWITVGGEAKLKRAALGRLELCNDSYLSANGPVMNALGRLLELGAPLADAIRARLRSNLDTLHGLLRGSAAGALASEGGWYTCLGLPETRSEEEWILAFAEAGLRVHPGWFYDFRGGAHGIVSLLVEPTVFARGIAELRAVVEAAI
jgi:aspartate/methionine/tyrosine aminotransferase